MHVFIFEKNMKTFWHTIKQVIVLVIGHVSMSGHNLLLLISNAFLNII